MSGQSKTGSLVEAIANIAAGVGVAFASQLVLFAYYGVAVPLSLNVKLTVWFTVVSLARSFLLRRFFNWISIRNRFYALLLLAALFVITPAHAARTRSTPSRASQYDRAVNETLDTTLWVIAQWRDARHKGSWRELQSEVCRNMNVRRTETWQR